MSCRLGCIVLALTVVAAWPGMALATSDSEKGAARALATRPSAILMRTFRRRGTQVPARLRSRESAYPGSLGGAGVGKMRSACDRVRIVQAGYTPYPE